MHPPVIGGAAVLASGRQWGSGVSGPSPLLMCPVWYVLHNGQDGGVCSADPRFTGNLQGVSSLTPPTRRWRAQTSTSKVIGPSLTEETCIRAPKTPVDTIAPRRRNSATTSSTSGSATSPGAASDQDGRRPLRVSA